MEDYHQHQQQQQSAATKEELSEKLLSAQQQDYQQHRDDDDDILRTTIIDDNNIAVNANAESSTSSSLFAPLTSQPILPDVQYDQQQQQQYDQQNGGGNNEINVNVQTNVDNSNEYKGEKQPNEYRDVIAAILFVGHLIFVLYYGLVHGLANISYSVPRYGSTETLHLGGMFLVFLLACGSSLVYTAMLVAILTRYAEKLIIVALWFTLISNVVLVALLAYEHYWTGFIMAVVFLIWTGLYMRNVWRRLPLCQALLQTSMEAIQTNGGLTLIAYGTVFALCLYTIVWILACIGMYVQNDLHLSVTAILMVLSYAWTSQVLQNILHATVSGVVATWWFAPHDACTFWSPSITDSLWRSTTYSFGSVCLASLLTAVVQVSYHVVNTIHRSQQWYRYRLSFVTCVSQCLLGFLERLVEYFHRYAIVYVSIYGYDFLTAGKKTALLFQSKGWTAVINDDLIARILTMTSWVVGASTGAIVLLFYNPNWIQDYFYNSDNNDSDSSSSSYGMCFFLSLILGAAVSNQIMSIVSSAVDTCLVAFAEAPDDLERNHPGLHRQMVDAWELIVSLTPSTTTTTTTQDEYTSNNNNNNAGQPQYTVV